MVAGQASEASMRCRKCETMIVPDPEKLGKPASSRASAAYVCANCGWAYSNARVETQRVAMAPSAELNVPAEVREGLSETLAQSANEVNRPNKREKFCFETSEDAVTWTVFRALEQTRQLEVIPRLLLEEVTGEPSLVLWGVPVAGPDSERIAAKLQSISDDLGEARRRRSEPDVIVVWPHRLVVALDAKYRSVNQAQVNYAHFDTYLRRDDLFAVDTARVKHAGQYELVRNWRIGVELAEWDRSRFVLVNLGPSTLVRDVDTARTIFAHSLDRRLEHLPWKALLVNAERPSWLESYAIERELFSA